MASCGKTNLLLPRLVLRFGRKEKRMMRDEFIACHDDGDIGFA
jgi:hypothetical protein